MGGAGVAGDNVGGAGVAGDNVGSAGVAGENVANQRLARRFPARTSENHCFYKVLTMTAGHGENTRFIGFFDYFSVSLYMIWERIADVG